MHCHQSLRGSILIAAVNNPNNTDSKNSPNIALAAKLCEKNSQENVGFETTYYSPLSTGIFIRAPETYLLISGALAAWNTGVDPSRRQASRPVFIGHAIKPLDALRRRMSMPPRLLFGRIKKSGN